MTCTRSATTWTDCSAAASRRGHLAGLRASCALLIAGALWLPGARAFATGPEAPQQVIEQAMSDVVGVLRDEQLSGDARRQKIEEIAYSRFDFERMSRLVLARNWRELSEAQRSDFEGEFRKHLSLTYGRRLNSYNDEEIEIVEARDVGSRGDVQVRTKIVGGAAGAEGIAIDYRLRERDGNWLVIDVIVEGVSLIQNFRAQVRDIISTQGVESLLEILREKNAKDAAAA